MGVTEALGVVDRGEEGGGDGAGAGDGAQARYERILDGEVIGCSIGSSQYASCWLLRSRGPTDRRVPLLRRLMPRRSHQQANNEGEPTREASQHCRPPPHVQIDDVGPSG